MESLSVDPADQESHQLPAEARTRIPNGDQQQQQQRNSAEQVVQYTYSQVPTKPVGQPAAEEEQSIAISEDEYLELVRNSEANRNPASPGPKYVYTATPTTPIPANPSATAGHDKQRPTPGLSAYKKPAYQASNPQQYVQQSLISNPVYQPNAVYRPNPYTDYAEGHKKHIEVSAKTKYDPNRGQFHQEKYQPQKYTPFKPSYQLSTSHLNRYHGQPQAQALQSQALQSPRKQHYQAVPLLRSAQPQSHPQPQFFQDSNIAYNSYQPQAERLVSAQYVSNNEESGQVLTKQQPTEDNVEYQSPNRYLPEPTQPKNARTQGVVSKYQYFDPTDPDSAPKEKSVKIVQAPQLQYDRPQYGEQVQHYHKSYPVKHHPQSVPQHHHQIVQPQPQVHHSQVLQPSQPDTQQVAVAPSRSTIYVSQGTGIQNSAPSEKHHAQIPAGHVTHTENQPLPLRSQEIRVPLPLPNPKRPLTQAEFQSLIDAGYKVTAIPVPVPVPVSAEKFKQYQRQQFLQQQQQQQSQPQPAHVPQAQALQQQQQQQPQQQQQQQHHPTANHYHRQPQASNTHYIRYQPQNPETTDESIFSSYLRPLIEQYIGGGMSKNNS